MGRKELIRCFEDTLYYSRNELNEKTYKSASSNKVYTENFESKKRKNVNDVSGIVEVVEMTSFDAARAFYNKKEKVAVLNFANPVVPGGGVTNGATAQEECLCRSSNLYPCLSAYNVQDDYYGYNKNLDTGMYSDRVIYTKSVCVFKDDKVVPEYLDKNDRINVDILTCAAPYKPHVKKLKKEDLLTIYKSRIKNILEVAVDNKVQTLILGAFGCGAFANPPEIMAEAFKETIEEGDYSSLIPTIIFAIKGQKKDRNFQIFKSAFETEKIEEPKVKPKRDKKKPSLDDQLTDALNEYNVQYSALNNAGIMLFHERGKASELINYIEALINTIANHPKEFDSDFIKINANKDEFKKASDFAEEELKTARATAAGGGAGVAAGVAVATMAPTAAMWVATTFGVASTGTAISTLSGAAATSAALAWLGGGALSVGGAGVAAGKALLALAGPVGWGIAGASVLTSVVLFSFNRSKKNKEKMEEINQVKNNTHLIKESTAAIESLTIDHIELISRLNEQFSKCIVLANKNYKNIKEEDRYLLGALVNNTKALSALIKQRI